MSQAKDQTIIEIERFAEKIPVDTAVIEKFLEGEVIGEFPTRSVRNSNEDFHSRVYLRHTQELRNGAQNSAISYAQKRKQCEEKRALLAAKLAEAEQSSSQGGDSQLKPWTRASKIIFGLLCCGLCFLILGDAMSNFLMLSSLVPSLATSPLTACVVSLMGTGLAGILKVVEQLLKFSPHGKLLYRRTLFVMLILVFFIWLFALFKVQSGGGIELMESTSIPTDAGWESLWVISQAIMCLLMVAFLGLYAWDFWAGHGTPPDTKYLGQLQRELEELDEEILELGKKERAAEGMIKILNIEHQNFISRADAQLLSMFHQRKKGA